MTKRKALDTPRESAQNSDKIPQFVASVMCEKPTSVVVSPAMVEAGMEAVSDLEYELWEGRTLEELSVLVSTIYRAMSAASEDRNVKTV